MNQGFTISILVHKSASGRFHGIASTHSQKDKSALRERPNVTGHTIAPFVEPIPLRAITFHRLAALAIDRYKQQARLRGAVFKFAHPDNSSTSAFVSFCLTRDLEFNFHV